jgi:hypothetical protein
MGVHCTQLCKCDSELIPLCSFLGLLYNHEFKVLLQNGRFCNGYSQNGVCITQGKCLKMI